MGATRAEKEVYFEKLKQLIETYCMCTLAPNNLGFGDKLIF